MNFITVLLLSINDLISGKIKRLDSAATSEFRHGFEIRQKP